MSTESIVTASISLEVRAERHAALADPLRLRVVDLLTLGDLTPTELQDALLVPSNLLAHHVKVLESSGLVRRVRSEADRRRSYVSLVPEALEGLGPSTTAAARRVVFVCTANSARSPLAEALWAERSELPTASAGTKPASSIAAGAVAAAQRHGVQLVAEHPRGIADVLEPDDLVITVCDAARDELGERSDLHWSIPDPARLGDDEAFDAAFDEITRRIERLATYLPTTPTTAQKGA